MEDNYKPSKEFTDQAWSDMKALLDKEMPDKAAILLAPDEKSRKGFLLLLPLLLLVAIAALFFYYQSNGDLSVADINAPSSTSELAVLPKIGSNNKESNLNLEKELSSTIAEGTKTVDNSPETSTLGDANFSFVNKSSHSNANNTPQISNVIPNKQIASKENQNSSQVEKTLLNKEIQNGKETKSLMPFISDKFYEPLEEVKEAKLEQEAKEKKVREPIALLEALGGTPLGFLSLTDENLQLDKFSNIKKLKSKFPIYGFVGARNYEFDDNIDFVAHVETVLRKADKKLGLRTGINYAQRSTTYLTKVETIAQAGLNDPVSAISFETADELAMLSEQFYAERAALNSNPIKYHFLEIPVFLDYKFSKKWSMHAGLAGKALIYSSEQNFGLLNGISLRKQDNNALLVDLENSPEGNRSVSYLSPQKFNIGTSLGLNYMATSRLGLQARYSRNLLDIYPELNGNQVSNSVELGLTWRLR